MPDKVDDKQSFEQALEELEAIIQQLEAGGLALDETLALYERGQNLAALCETRLSEAEFKLADLRSEE